MGFHVEPLFNKITLMRFACSLVHTGCVVCVMTPSRRVTLEASRIRCVALQANCSILWSLQINLSTSISPWRGQLILQFLSHSNSKSSVLGLETTQQRLVLVHVQPEESWLCTLSCRAPVSPLLFSGDLVISLPYSFFIWRFYSPHIDIYFDVFISHNQT